MWRLLARRRGPRVTITPAIPEWDEHPDDYREVVAVLRERGLRAGIGRPVPPYGSDLPAFVPTAVAAYIAGAFSRAVVDLVAEELMSRVIQKAKLRWWPDRVKVVIYGPNHEVLREIEVAPREPDSP